MRANQEQGDKRVFFKKDVIRKEFFDILKKKFDTFSNLQKYFKLYRSRLEKFRKGRILVPHELFLNFLGHIDDKDKKYFLNNIILKPSNWGRIRGGVTTYTKYKKIFEEGRKLPKKTKYTFSIGTPLTYSLSEIIGAFIGDGFTNKYKTMYIVQFTGDARLDKDYYLRTIIPKIKEISADAKPKLTLVQNTLRLTIYSKEFYELLTKRFNLPAGKKSYTVKIPKEILDSEDLLNLNYCIRGIFDTDGCVFFDKRGTYAKPYIRIGLSLENKPLINEIYYYLNKIGINAMVTANSKVIQMNGTRNCKKFIDFIGFSNPRHLRKINKFFNRNGNN